MKDKTGSRRLLSSQILFSVWGRKAGEAQQCLQKKNKNSAGIKKKNVDFYFSFQVLPIRIPFKLEHFTAYHA